MSRGRGEEGRGGIFEGGSSAGGGRGGERRMRRMGVWRESRVEMERWSVWMFVCVRGVISLSLRIHIHSLLLFQLYIFSLSPFFE